VSAGPIALDKLPPDTVAALPVADSLEDLKVLLSLGYSELSQRQKTLERLGNVLRKDDSATTLRKYWNQSPSPEIIDAYQGFNLVAYGDRYLALNQVAGEIDLIGSSLTDLTQKYGIDVVLVGATISDLCNQIDGLTTSQRLRAADHQTLEVFRQEAEKANEQVLKKIEAGQADQEKLAKRLEERIATERQVAEQALETLRHETATANDQVLAKIEAGKAEQAEKIKKLELNWAFRLSRRFRQIVLGTKK
jgi:vacuolar-type H+-ATPase subunit I/STV1